MKKDLRKKFNWLFKEKIQFTGLSNEDYYEKFGVLIDPRTKTKFIQDKEKLLYAYNKAWENRDFEINKFWTRAAYFWGFIVLIFGAYLNIISKEKSALIHSFHIDYFLLLIGTLFSISWYLLILGSKSWQRNWEAHIDRLEDLVSGPLYKTVFYSGKTSYSVSKLNEVLALLVIIMWVGILSQHIYSNYTIATNIKNINWIVTIAFLVFIIFLISLIFGYTANKYVSKRKYFYDRWEK